MTKRRPYREEQSSLKVYAEGSMWMTDKDLDKIARILYHGSMIKNKFLRREKEDLFIKGGINGKGMVCSQ